MAPMKFLGGYLQAPRASARFLKLASAAVCCGKTRMPHRFTSPPHNNDREAQAPVSPTPPVSHLSRGVAGDEDHLATTTGPCDAIFASSQVEDRYQHRLLLLPAFCLFRRLLRRCLCFSLLRHCCPPSLSGWRYRCSAVANRRTLLSDYYSRKKITVTPLNIVCKCRASLLRTSQSTALSKHAQKTFLVRAQTNTAQSTHHKNLDVMRVSRMRLFDC